MASHDQMVTSDWLTGFWLWSSQIWTDLQNSNYGWTLWPLATILVLGHVTKIEASDWLRAKMA